MTVTFKRETLDEWLADARFVLEDHLRDSGETLESSLNVNHDFYIDLDRRGALYILTGRNEKRELVAYWIGMRVPNILYQHFNTVYSMGYWVRPDFRGFTVYRFTKFIDQYFEDAQVKNIVQNARTINRMAGILEKLGYRKVEEVYTKVY